MNKLFEYLVKVSPVDLAAVIVCTGLSVAIAALGIGAAIGIATGVVK